MANSTQNDRSLPNNKQNTGRSLSRNTLEIIYRHLVKTQAKSLLAIGNTSDSVLNYAQYSGIEEAVGLDSRKIGKASVNRAKPGGLQKLNFYDSFSTLRDEYQNKCFDCMVCGPSTPGPTIDVKALLQLTAPGGSLIVVDPLIMHSEYVGKLEEGFPLVISTCTIQIMLRSYPGESRKVFFTTQNWSKPWELIHAL